MKSNGRRKLRKVFPKSKRSSHWHDRTSPSPVTSFRRKPNVVGLYLIMPPPLSLALGLSLFSQHNRTEARFGLVGRRLEG
ncbi:hypothetical protein LXL04_017045 [Taraxacum kok-saghyz]